MTSEDVNDKFKPQDDDGQYQEQHEAVPRWRGRHDPDNPFNWPRSKKWLVTLVACYVTFIVGTNSTSIAAAPAAINRRFGVSDASFPNSFWPITAWNTGAALAPMIVLPILENHGLRLGYLSEQITYAIFVAFVIPQALAPNFATLIVCRFIAGCCGGVLQDVMDGIIADIWEGPVQRSLPVSTYVFALLAGVTLGPVFGGAIVGHLYWRWIFYIQLIIYGGSFPIVLLAMKETRGPVLLAKRATTEQKQPTPTPGKKSKKNSASLVEFLHEAVGRPARLLCTEPVCLFFTLLSGLSYGLVFLSTQSVAVVYAVNYGWDGAQAGLLQSSIAIGELVGYFACFVQDNWYARKAGQLGQHLESPESSLPEVRLYVSVPGCLIGLSGGLFCYGWTSYPSLPWILPSIGLALLGFGTMTVMQAIMMYITDSYQKYAGSASAAVCCGENLFAAFLPLAANSMYKTLGFQWASSLLAFVALALSFAPIALIWKGPAIRRRSPFIREAVYDNENSYTS